MANVSATQDRPMSVPKVEQCLEAAGPDCTPACYRLAMMHLHGHGVKKSEDKAAKYLHAPVEQFFPPAALDYAIHLEGSGRLRDAIIWYERLAGILTRGLDRKTLLDARSISTQCQFLAGAALLKSCDARGYAPAYFWLHRGLSLSDLYYRGAADLMSAIGKTYGTRCANCQAPKPKFQCAHCGLFMYCNKDHREGYHKGCQDNMKNLQSSIEIVCDLCTKLNPPFQCAGCNETCYCDEICQKLHWALGHKNECCYSEIK